MWAADAAPITGTLVTAAVTLLVGVFGGGTIVALIRVSADRGKVVIEAAQGAVIVQTGVIEALQDELNRLKADRDERDQREARLRAEVAELRSGRDAEVAELRSEVARLRSESVATAARLARVERAGGGPAVS